MPGMPPLVPPRGHPEDEMHAAIWKALCLVLAPTVVAWSTENRRNGLLEGVRRRLRGMIAGVPDMVFHWQGGIAYVELKVPGGRPSEAQVRLQARLRAIGVPVAVCTSLDQVLAFLRDCGCPMRARIL